MCLFVKVSYFEGRIMKRRKKKRVQMKVVFSLASLEQKVGGGNGVLFQRWE